MPDTIKSFPLLHISENNSRKTIDFDDSIVDVTGIMVTPEATNLAFGGTLVLEANVLPENATNKDVIWTSDDPSIISVASNGEVTGISFGTTIISATTVEGGFVAQSTVTVVGNSQVNVTGVDLDVDSTILEVGQTQILEAIITPMNATNSAVFWASEDTSIVSVDVNGEIIGVAIGTTVVSATTEDGDFVAQAAITVVENTIVNVSGIDLNLDSTNLEFGSTLVLEETVQPSNATNTSVIWASEDTSIVTVDANGEVFGVALGTTTVTVTTEDGNFVTQAIITVIESEFVNVTGIIMNPDSIDLELGSSLVLNVAVQPNNATNQQVVWTSEDTSIVSVNSNGEVLGVSLGTTTVNATTVDGEFVAVATVKVVEKSEENNGNVVVTGISIDIDDLVLQERDNVQINGTVLPENASNNYILWVPEDLSIVTVDANGNVEAKRVGETVITATTVDGGFSTTITVTVLPNNVIVYPNPTSDFINITGIDERIGVFIHNSSGVLVKSTKGRNPIYIGDLSNASYLIRLSTGDRIRFVKR